MTFEQAQTAVGKIKMLSKMSNFLNYFILVRKFKRTRKKRGALSFRVASVVDFLSELEAAGIRHAVLRWPDKVPTSPLPANSDVTQIDALYGDVDILLELKDQERKRILEIGARHLSKRGIRCEFYNTYGSGGFCYKRYPYYPPIMARSLLEGRVLDPRGFYRLAGKPYIASLAYHVVYHKAASICSSASAQESEKIADYLGRLGDEAAREGVALPCPLNVETLNSWLIDIGYDMPFDLKIRWPRNAGLLTALSELDIERFTALSPDGFHYFCIFILRDDLEKVGLVDKAVDLISERFDIRQKIFVPKEKRLGLAAHLRGGNWMEGKHGDEILPCVFLICDDPAPRLLETPLPNYPHLDNANLRWKQRLREELSRISGRRIYGVHSSDNKIEATCVLDALKREGFC